MKQLGPGMANMRLKACSSVAMAVFLLHTSARPKPQPAAATLIRKISAMRQVDSWRANFICEKRLAVLQHPFISSGVMAIARPDHVRFDTLKPYHSCIILAGRMVYLRGQTNRHWHTAALSRAQAISLIMDQMADWALGHTTGLQQNYRITRHVAAEPPQPDAGGGKTAKTKPSGRLCTFFTLNPRKGLPGRVVTHLTLGFIRHSARLVFFAIDQKNGDRQQYWIKAAQLNPHLPANYFKPAGRP